MTVINHKSISGITSITAPAGSDDLLTVHTNDTTERFRIVDSGAIVTGVTTASNFKTGTTNVHNVGVELAGINVLGADTPIGTGATIYNSGAAVFTGVVTATSFSGTLDTAAQTNITSLGTLTGLVIDNNADTSMSGSSAGQLQVGGDGYTGAIALDDDAMHIYHNSSSRALVLGTNETERLRISGTGKLTFDYDGSTENNLADIDFRTNNGFQIRGFDGNSNNAKIYIGGAVGNQRKTAIIHDPVGGYCRGDLHFCLENAADLTDVDVTDSKMVIKADGKIGIGTVSPSYQLQSHESGGNLLRLLTSHEGNYDLRYVYQNSEANIWSYGSTDLTFGTRYNKKLHLVTNGPGKRLTIDGSGNIGINQTAPAVELDIKATSPEIRLTCSDNNLDQGDTIGQIGWYTTDPTTPGGAGTVSYINTFSANGNGADYSTKIFNRDGSGGGSTYIQLGSAAGAITFGTNTAGNGGVERLRITSDGKVGINQANPTSQLWVQATTDDNPGVTLYRQSTGGDIASLIWQTGSGTQAKINYRGAAGANEGLQFYTAGGSSSQLRMIIDHSGKVGINRNDPAELLDVYGTIQCSGAGLKIDTHPLVSYASFSDISGGTYAARLGSTGSSTIRSTQIYGGGNHIATFDGVNYRLGILETTPEASIHITGGLPHIRLENSGTSASAGDILGQIDFKHNDSDDPGVTASIKCIAEDNAGNSYLTFNNNDGGNADERMRITSSKGVLINHTSDGDISDVHGLKVASVFRHQARGAAAQTDRGFYSTQTGSGSYSSGYFHMKTDIATNSSAMFLITVRGYAYGQSKVVFCQTCGYCYGSHNNIINTQAKSWDGTTSVTTYKSSDGYVVIRFTPGGWSSYYMGFCVDIAQQNPAKSGLNHKVTAFALESASDHYA